MDSVAVSEEQRQFAEGKVRARGPVCHCRQREWRLVHVSGEQYKFLCPGCDDTIVLPASAFHGTVGWPWAHQN